MGRGAVAHPAIHDQMRTLAAWRRRFRNHGRRCDAWTSIGRHQAHDEVKDESETAQGAAVREDMTRGTAPGSG